MDERERYLALRNIRQTIKTPPQGLSPEVINHALEQGLQPIEAMFMRQLQTSRTIPAEMERLQRSAQSRKGHVHEPAVLAACYVMDQVVIPLEDLAIDTFQSGSERDAWRVALYCDASHGMNISIGRILIAERFEDGDLMGPMERTAFISRGDPFLATQSRRDIFSSGLKEGEKCADLLEKDPTGFGIIDDTIAQIRSDPLRVLFPNQLPQFALAGAESARRMHLAVLPLAH